eukprot:tig00020965_g16847.t1
MATPAVAGLAALVRQYYREGRYADGTVNATAAITPSGSLVKATIINSARALTGKLLLNDSSNYLSLPTSVPNKLQGFGRPQLDRALRRSDQGTSFGNFVFHERYMTLADVGTVHSYTLTMDNMSVPLIITMTYADYPASTSAALALVIDVDLWVENAAGTVIYANGGSSFDRLNNPVDDTKSQSNAQPVAEPEPIAEPKPVPEPQPVAKPEPVAHRDAEPQPVAKPVAHRDAEPQPVAHRDAEPQPVAHRDAEPEPVAHRDTKPQPVAHRDAEPEPVAHRDAEPEPVAHRDAEPEPVAHRDAEPQPVAHRDAEPEPVAHRDAEPEPVAHRDAEPEPVAHRDAEPQPVAHRDAEPEPVAHRDAEPEPPSPTETPSPSPSPTETPSPSPSPTETPSPSPSPTETPSPSPSPTETPSPSPSPTDVDETPSPSPSPADETPSPSPSPADETPSPSPSPADETPSPSPSPADETPSPSPSPADETPSPSPSPADETPSPSPSPADETPSPSPSPADETPSPSPSPTNETRSPSPSPADETPSPSPSPADEMPSPSPSPADATPSPSPSPADETPSPSPSPADETPSPSPSPADETPSPSPSPVDETPSPSPSPADETPSPSPSPADETPSPSPSPADETPSPSPSPADETPSPSPSPADETPSPSPSPTETPSPSPSPTETPSPSPSPADETPSPSPSPVDVTPSPSPSPADETPSPSPSPTNETPSPSPSPADETPSPSPSPTNETPSPSPSPADETPSPSPLPADETPSPSPSPADETPSPSPSPVDETPSPSPSTMETPSPSPSPTETPSPSPSTTETPSPSPSPADETPSPSPSPADATPSPSPSRADETPSPSPSPADETPSPSPSPTDVDETPSPSQSPADEMPSPSPSPADETPSPSPSPADETPSPSPSPTDETPSPSPSPTAGEPTATPSPSASPATPTAAGPTATPSPSASPDTPTAAEPTATPSPSASPDTPTAAEPTATPSPSASPDTPTAAGPTATPSPSASPDTPVVAEPTATPSPSASPDTPVVAEPTATPSPSASPDTPVVAEPTATPSPSASPDTPAAAGPTATPSPSASPDTPAAAGPTATPSPSASPDTPAAAGPMATPASPDTPAAAGPTATPSPSASPDTPAAAGPTATPSPSASPDTPAAAGPTATPSPSASPTRPQQPGRRRRRRPARAPTRPQQPADGDAVAQRKPRHARSSRADGDAVAQREPVAEPVAPPEPVPKPILDPDAESNARAVHDCRTDGDIAFSGGDRCTAVRVLVEAGKQYDCRTTVSNSRGSSPEVSFYFTTRAGPALPQVAVPDLDVSGASVASRDVDGRALFQVRALASDSVTSATVTCKATTAVVGVVDPDPVTAAATSTEMNLLIPLASGTEYACRASTANAAGTSLEATRTFSTRAGPAVPRITAPAADGDVDVERDAQGRVSVVLAALAIDKITSASVTCRATVDGAVDLGTVQVTGLSSPTSVSILVPLEALTGYECRATTANAGGASSVARRTFLTKKGPAPIVASSSKATGAGLCAFQTVDSVVQLTVQAVDSEGVNVVGRNPGTLTARLVSLTASDPTDPTGSLSFYGATPAADTAAAPRVINNLDGTFTVEYSVPPRRGTYELHLELATDAAARSGAISGSPFRVFALPSAQTTASIEKLPATSKALAKYPLGFFAAYRDKNGNFMGSLPAGVDGSTCAAAATLRAASAPASPISIQVSGGTLGTDYTLQTFAGTYAASGNWSDSIALTAQSPRTLTVTASAAGSTVYTATVTAVSADVSLATSGVAGAVCKAYTAGTTFTARVELKDVQGKLVGAGGSNVSVTAAYLGPSSTAPNTGAIASPTLDPSFRVLVNPSVEDARAASASVRSNDDGTYVANILAIKAGYYRLAVLVDGKAVAGNGAVFFVYPGAPAAAPSATYPGTQASGLEWLSASSSLASDPVRAYVAARDELGNLVSTSAYYDGLPEPAMPDTIAASLGFTAALDATAASTCRDLTMPAPWAATAAGSTASSISIKSSAESAAVRGIYTLELSICSAGLHSLQASQASAAMGKAFALSVRPNVLSGVAGQTIAETVADLLPAEASNSLRVTGMDVCGNVVDFDQAPNNAFNFAFADGVARLPMFADFVVSGGSTPLCSYVVYRGLTGCFRSFTVERVTGTAGTVVLSYQLFASGKGTIRLFVNRNQETFVQGARLVGSGTPAATLAVERTPKEAIKLNSARFSDEGNAVLITLSEPSDMLQTYITSSGAIVNAQGYARARAIFANGDALFGPDSYCSFRDASTLEVTISGAKEDSIPNLVKIGTTVSIAAGGASIFNAIGNSAPIPNTVAVLVQAPANPPKPVVTLSGDKEVGKCDVAEYVAGVSTGGCGRPLSFSWVMTSADGSVTVDASKYSKDTPPFLFVKSSQSGAGPAAGDYVITVVGTNFLGQSSEPARAPLKISAGDPPRIVIAEGAQLTTKKASRMTMNARASFSSCVGGAAEALVFKWFVDGVLQSESGPSFAVGPGGKVLEPNTADKPTYTITVEGAFATNPDQKNSFSATLTVVPSALVASAQSFSSKTSTFAPDDLALTSTIGSTAGLLLDATASFDPDNVIAAGGFDDKLQCKWSVASGSPAESLPKDASLHLAAGAAVSLEQNGCRVKIASGSLKADPTMPTKPFTFVVEVTRSDGINRAAQKASISVLVVQYSPPTVSISIKDRPATSRRVNANQDIVLVAALGAPGDVDAAEFATNGAAAYRLAYRWSVSSAATLDLENTEVVPSSTDTNLVLRKNLLRSGQDYTFVLSVTMAVAGETRKAAGEITVSVNRPPASGSCTLRNKDGKDAIREQQRDPAQQILALTEEYRLLCSDWVTSSNPLSYRFTVAEEGGTEEQTLRDFAGDSTLPRLRIASAKSKLFFRAYIKDAENAVTTFQTDAFTVTDALANLNAEQAAALIDESTRAQIDKCLLARDYVCAFGGMATASSSALSQSSSTGARRRLQLLSSSSSRRLSAASPALLQIQVNALRSAIQAVESASYAPMAVAAASSQLATVLSASFVADYAPADLRDAIGLASNLSAAYVRDCAVYDSATDSVVRDLVRASLNAFSNDEAINGTSHAELRRLVSQLGRRSLECGRCASSAANWTSPVASYAAPEAARGDAELLPIQLCVSRTLRFPPQTVAFAGYGARVGLPSSFALSVLGNDTTDSALDVVAFRLPSVVYGRSERFASDVVQLAVYKSRCGASCSTLPADNLEQPVSFADFVPAAAAFDTLSERISLSRFNATAASWTEAAPGAIALRSPDGRYASAARSLIPAGGAPRAFVDLANVVRTRPESRNASARATLSVDFPFYAASSASGGNATAASVFASGPSGSEAALVTALAARIRSRAAAVGAAAALVADFDEALQLAVESGAVAASAPNSVEGVAVTFSFFGVANARSARPSAAQLRDFVYAEAVLRGLDLSALDPQLVGGVPLQLDGQRIRRPGTPGVGGFRNDTHGPLAVAVRESVNGTVFGDALQSALDLQVAYTRSERGSIVSTFQLYRAIPALPAADGGFALSSAGAGAEPIARALVFASLRGGLSLPLANGKTLHSGVVRSVGSGVAGLASLVVDIHRELSAGEASGSVPAGAPLLNFTVRVENAAGSLEAWVRENYDALPEGARDDFWRLALHGLLRRLDPRASLAGLSFPGRGAFADGVSNGTAARRFLRQLGVAPSVDITASYRGNSSVLGSGSGFSRNSSFCGQAYSLMTPTGAASASPRCTDTGLASLPRPAAGAGAGAGSAFNPWEGGAAPSAPASSHQTSTTAILAGVFGCVGFVALVAGAVFVVKWRRGRDQAQGAPGASFSSSRPYNVGMPTQPWGPRPQPRETHFVLV